MSRPERQQNVLELLKGLRGIEPLKRLFWSELNYQRVNQPLSRRGWTDTASKALADDPVLFAGGGENNDFHVIYSRLASDKLLLGGERPVVSRLLNEHPYTLFVFSNAEQDRWHFLNVKYDEAGDKRRLFRRITVGPEERLRTASERISLLSLDAISPELFGLAPLTIQQHHDEAFNVEAVTKKFFDDFCKTFTAVAKDIRERNKWMDDEAIERETQTLLNRLLFLYFIQRKGWMNRRRDYLYANFKQTHAAAPDGTNYYSEFLYRLFIRLSTEGEYYETLGNLPFLNGGLFNDEYGGQQRQEVLLRRARMKIGNGIFRRVFDDLLEAYNFTVREDTPLNQEVAIDPEMLGKIFESLVLQIEQSDTGGKTSRHDTGSFYTPRPIVHYLCREGLRCWLEQIPPVAASRESAAESSAKKDGRVLTNAATENDWPARLEKLLALDASEGLDADEQAVLDTCLTPEEARALLERLDNLRACDPAVGSGAFPVGLLHEVLNLRRLCETRSRGRDPVEGDRNWLYDTKARIIERVIYGVDIQQRAIEICKLRLWLSLMVDFDPGVDIEKCSAKAFSDALKKIPALPNLDFKIRRANSLVDMVRGHPLNLKHGGADEKGMLPPILNKLITAKREFYDAYKIADKRRLRFNILDATAELAMYEFSAAKTELGLFAAEKDKERLAELSVAEREMGWLRQQVRAARKLRAEQQDDALERLTKTFDDEQKPTFVWQLDFAEVFHRKTGTGFDLVLANPPYVRMELFKEQKPALITAHPLVHDERADLYCYFYGRAIQILLPGGALSFISSNKWFRAGYGARLRKYVADNCNIRSIVDFGELPVFENAATFPMIFVATRGKQTNQQAHFTQVRSLESPYPDVSALITQQGHLLPPDAIAGERWLLADSNSANRIRQMELVGCPLSRYVAGKILLGIKTGLNKAFWLSRDEYKAIVRKQPQCAEILKPLLVGDDIRKWHMRDSASWLIYTPHGIDMSVYRAVVEHLRPWKDKLENRALDQQWYELQQPQFRYAAYFSKPKIVYPDIALESRFTLDVEKHYVDMTAFAIPSDDLFLLGVLNSSAVWAYLREKAAVLGDPAKRGRLRLKRQYLEQLPILTAPPNECSAITTLVQKCLDARGQGAGLADWEAEINERVARLYGLTPEEIKIVESASAEPAARQGKAAK